MANRRCALVAGAADEVLEGFFLPVEVVEGSLVLETLVGHVGSPLCSIRVDFTLSDD